MNCRSAQKWLSATQDGALADFERAGLAAHAAECSECRQFQSLLGEAQQHLQALATQVALPDEERAWRDIRSEIRATRPVALRAWWNLGRWALPVGAAAALAAVVVIGPSWMDGDGPQTVARAEFVEVPADASSVVYVDDNSGWLVVWASDVKSG